MKHKYLVENARITDAYLSMYHHLNESKNNSDEKAVITALNKNGTSTSKSDRDDLVRWSKEKEKMRQKEMSYAAEQERRLKNARINRNATTTQYPQNGDVEYTGDEEDYLAGKPVPKPSTLGNNVKPVITPIPPDREYPENGDVEYTEPELRYLRGEMKVRPSTIPPTSRKNESTDIDGDEDGFSAMVEDVLTDKLGDLRTFLNTYGPLDLALKYDGNGFNLMNADGPGAGIEFGGDGKTPIGTAVTVTYADLGLTKDDVVETFVEWVNNGDMSAGEALEEFERNDEIIDELLWNKYGEEWQKRFPDART